MLQPLPDRSELRDEHSRTRSAQRFEAVYDPWRAGRMAQEWEQRGIPAVAFPQSDSRMIPASERLYDVIVHKRLVHPDDPELNAHIHAAVAKHSRRGWRLDKADRSSKIDVLSRSRWQ